MENKILRLGGRSTQDIYKEIKPGSSEKWVIQSKKSEYVNGKLSGVIEVDYSISIDNPDYLLEEDKSDNTFCLTARNDGTSGICVLTQNESGNKINLNVTTPQKRDYWQIRFDPLLINGVYPKRIFYTVTNIDGEDGYMDINGTQYSDLVVNQNRYMINVYIDPDIDRLSPGSFDMLSWSCFDKNGKAFSPNYNISDNQYFTTRTTGLGSYTLKKISSPSVDKDTPILTSRFNPTKKYPLDLNFYWAKQSQLNTRIKIISQL